MRLIHKTALAAMAMLISGLLSGTATAHPQPTDASIQSAWTAQYTRGDVGGAHASGHIYKRGDGRVQLTGTLWDTKKSDHKLAILQTWATYADGGHRYERDVTGSSKALGSDGYNFASSVRDIQVQECLGHKTASGRLVFDKCAPGWATIW
ncbi:hypothetical protein [Streptomyces longisporus]|uniref:Secreted protein n=1 Tax=Streptomyces longisporus TaxID=1948 RepID=A0ABN3LJ58_STRLO